MSKRTLLKPQLTHLPCACFPEQKHWLLLSVHLLGKFQTYCSIWAQLHRVLLSSQSQHVCISKFKQDSGKHLEFKCLGVLNTLIALKSMRLMKCSVTLTPSYKMGEEVVTHHLSLRKARGGISEWREAAFQLYRVVHPLSGVGFHVPFRKFLFQGFWC